MKHITVGIQADIIPGQEGGMEQALIGLVQALGKLDTPHLHYRIVTHWQAPDWLGPYLGPGQQLAPLPRPSGQGWHEAKNILGPLRPWLGRAKRALLRQKPRAYPPIPTDSGFYAGLGLDVLHIINPLNYLRTPIPTVFTLHDLQHAHFPAFFGEAHLQWRAELFPTALNESRRVVAIADWVRHDAARYYGTPQAKMRTVHWGAPTRAYTQRPTAAQVAQVKAELQLPDRFLLYPALTYAHKNHLRLLEAVHLLRQQGQPLHVVCTGTQKLFWPHIRAAVERLELGQWVHFTGHLPPTHLLAVYALARAVVLPTLFEGAGLPLLEAFAEAKPLACSRIAAFEEYGGTAPLFFDPCSVPQMAEAMHRLMHDDDLCRQLVAMGQAQIQLFSWEKAAQQYAQVYAQAAQPSPTP